MASIAISGSTAYDYIMDYKGNLSNELKNDKTHKLSINFLIEEMKKEVGGTGLNISYNLALLGEKAILLSSIGNDFEFSDFIKENVNLDFVIKHRSKLTSSSYITTDASQNQITAFHPGAMEIADSVLAGNVDIPVSYGIIAPNKKEAMILHSKEMKNFGVKVFFDPGHQLHRFNKEELIKISKTANYLIINDNEYEDYKNILELNHEEILKFFDKIIITYGEHGSKIISDTEIINLPAIRCHEISDATGVGDAYRAGLVKGLNSGYNWEISGKIASLLASFCLGSNGAQNHFIEKKHFEAWFLEEFGEEINL